MKKGILAGSVVGVVAMGSVNAAIEVDGDLEMLEGVEGRITVFNDSAAGNPKFEYVSGAMVSITVDPAYPLKAKVVPGEVSADTESTVRITAGSETIDHTFKVVNEAEPEQANGKTIAQCTFYNNYKGHTGIAGMGAFSFDKQTVDNLLMPTPSSYVAVEHIVSSTRFITGSVDSGLTVFTEDDDSLRIVKGSFVTGGHYKAWYAGFGYRPGYADTSGRGPGPYFVDGYWSNDDSHFTNYPVAGFSFSGNGNYANDSAVHGSWSAGAIDTLGDGVKASSEGFFDCTLSDVGDMSTCGGSFDLPNNQWQQISLPCYPISSRVSDVFANIPGTYDSDWVVYEYDTKDNINKYAKLGVGDRLEQGKGYWIIQDSGAKVTLTMPQGSIPTLVTQHAGCTEEKGCFEIPLATNSSNNQWNLVGFPFSGSQNLSRARIATHTQGCNTQAGCTLSSASKQGFVYNQLWRYVGSKTGYMKITASDTLTPWSAYWSLTLPNAEAAGPVGLIVPKP